MTDHLPECLNDDDTYGWRRWCICEELRACEKRVLIAARQAVEAELGWEDADPSDDFKPHTAIWKFRALAAIDALRLKP